MGDTEYDWYALTVKSQSAHTDFIEAQNRKGFAKYDGAHSNSVEAQNRKGFANYDGAHSNSVEAPSINQRAHASPSLTHEQASTPKTEKEQLEVPALPGHGIAQAPQASSRNRGTEAASLPMAKYTSIEPSKREHHASC